MRSDPLVNWLERFAVLTTVIFVGVLVYAVIR